MVIFLLRKGGGNIPPFGIPSIHPLHVVINHEKKRDETIDEMTPAPAKRPVARNEYLKIKDNLGSFNFKTIRKYTPSPIHLPPRQAMPHMRPEREVSVSVQKKPTLIKERRYRSGGGGGGGKDMGTQKAPSIAPKTPRKRVRKEKKNICQKIPHHLDRSVMLLVVNYFAFPTIGDLGFACHFVTSTYFLQRDFISSALPHKDSLALRCRPQSIVPDSHPGLPSPPLLCSLRPHRHGRKPPRLAALL